MVFRAVCRPDLGLGATMRRLAQSRTFLATWRRHLFLGAALVVSGVTPLVMADPPAAVAPPAPVPKFTLDECLAIGRAQQPSLQAAHASLAAAQAAQRGLNEIRFGAVLSRELPVRRQQAALGVQAAAANLAQAERDVDCSVARMFYSVIYAREQQKLAESIVTRLKAVVANGETLLGKEGAPADLTVLSIEKAKIFSAMAQSRADEAARGLGRATAGLREAMGVGQDLTFHVAEAKLPEPLAGVSKEQIISLAVSLRGEISQAESAACITNLEIAAQSKSLLVKRPTSAAGGDMHAKPIPTGSFGDDYKPGAIGIDFPTLFVGPRSTRVQRASELAVRAGAVAEKARNLVALEAEDAYLKWEEAFSKIGKLRKAVAEADAIARKANSALESGILQSYRDVLELQVMAAQLQAQLNEALYHHAVALTELERVTAGGYPAGATLKLAAPR